MLSAIGTLNKSAYIVAIMLTFSHQLDLLMEEPVKWQFHSHVTSLAKQLAEAQHALVELQHKATLLRMRMVGDLAARIRKRAPALNVAADKICCKVGYKSKILELKPDIEKEIWWVESSDKRFMREFLTANRPHTVMTDDIRSLVDGIIKYFDDHYRSFNEAVTGKGVVLIDGRLGSLSELAAFGHEVRPINSRLVRRADGCQLQTN